MNFRESPKGELRRIPILRTSVNSMVGCGPIGAGGNSSFASGYPFTYCLAGVSGVCEGKNSVRLAGLILLLSDALLAAPVWLAAFELQRILGRWNLMGWEGYPRTTAMLVGVFAVAVWIGLRSLMGLYPGYGLSSAERLRRHRYSVALAFLAALSFVIVLDIRDTAPKSEVFDLYGDFFPRLLVLGFMGILLLSPLVQSLARWGMGRLGIWDSPVNDGPR
jgi:hypothetical protein